MEIAEEVEGDRASDGKATELLTPDLTQAEEVVSRHAHFVNDPRSPSVAHSTRPTPARLAPIVAPTPMPTLARADRAALTDNACTLCSKFYDAFGTSIPDLGKHIDNCSHHCHRRPRPHTPPSFWDLGFPDEP